jgi:hypothetical protein
LPQQREPETSGRSADCEAHTDLVRALGDGVRCHAIDSDERQQHGKAAEKQNSRGVEAGFGQSFVQPLAERHGAVYGDLPVHLLSRIAEERQVTFRVSAHVRHKSHEQRRVLRSRQIELRVHGL